MSVQPTTIQQSAFLELEFVSKCLAHLRNQKIHRHFAGYLCICHTAAREGRREKLKPEFKAFFDRFLAVGDAPEGTPYVVPFSETGSADANVWMNSNVAGSYAVSSLRPQAPLRRVADLFGSGRTATFSLVDEHEAACVEHLLFNHRINAIALAGFFLRDHSFIVSDGSIPSIEDLKRELFILLGFGEDGFSRVLFDEDEAFDVGQIWAPVSSPQINP